MTDRFTLFTIRNSHLNKLIQKLKTEGMGRFGLKGVDTLCLYQLGLHGPMTFAEIAGHCDLDPALVSRTLRGLTRSNMVCKEGGKYKALYSLTEEGQELNRSITAIICRIQNTAIQGITLSEMATFYRVLDRLTDNLEHLPGFTGINTALQEDPTHESEDHH